jgi:5'-nucleotidase
VAVAAAVTVGVLATSCSSSSGSSATTSTAPPATAVLHVLVTNDDGVGAPGINAAVQALRSLPYTQVTVVAPLTNQSGTGGKTTAGPLTVTDAETASGYAAKAVHGYPADTIKWAIVDHGVSVRPDLVVSGINFGQNIGPLADGSGTVGAAQAALALGIPALATSQGLDNGLAPLFSQGAHQLTMWVQSHRASLIAVGGRGATSSSSLTGNMNIPSCANGNIRGPIHVPLATSLTGVDITTVDCTSTATNPANDAEGFVEGFAVIAPLGT